MKFHKLYKWTCYRVSTWLSDGFDWLGLNAVFNSFSVISQWPVHFIICFLIFSHHYSTQYTFQATGCFSKSAISPLVKDEWHLLQLLLSNIGKNAGRAGVQTVNPWIDISRQYRLRYWCSDGGRSENKFTE